MELRSRKFLQRQQSGGVEPTRGEAAALSAVIGFDGSIQFKLDNGLLWFDSGGTAQCI